MRRASFLVILIAIPLSLSLLSCGQKEGKNIQHGKLRVVTTLFPLYDFARQVGGGRAEVTMLLPPGVEAHAYEPRPADMERIQKADMFIFTGKIMEPWVDDLLKGVDTKGLRIVDASRGIHLLNAIDEGHEEAGLRHVQGAAGLDPHIWLDFSNAATMVDAIAAGFMEKDPAGRAVYGKNAAAYKVRLGELDRRYEETLSRCENKIIIHAGHFAFGYLARRYHLTYISAYEGFNPDSEPTPKRLVALIETIKKNGSKTLYYEELITPRVAQVIGKETGATLLMLHAAHNVTKEDLDGGVDFTSLMERNLANLKVGLQCP